MASPHPAGLPCPELHCAWGQLGPRLAIIHSDPFSWEASKCSKAQRSHGCDPDGDLNPQTPQIYRPSVCESAEKPIIPPAIPPSPRWVSRCLHKLSCTLFFGQESAITGSTCTVDQASQLCKMQHVVFHVL
ncbi:hypothetical protein AAFF_G00329450 [Aldrovandia affinis]|uniref:Uncharacterized protein n=1 Tax=Aldrovandia affinis TaxID=143900 RepID=A0AAD7SLS6_9TELE|nr:hypothetical protein AAFF_G00329450 [Aldrovandia affinis]